MNLGIIGAGYVGLTTGMCFPGKNIPSFNDVGCSAIYGIKSVSTP